MVRSGPFRVGRAGRRRRAFTGSDKLGLKAEQGVGFLFNLWRIVPKIASPFVS